MANLNTCGYNIRGKARYHILRITMRINSVTLHLLVCHLISSNIHENIFEKNVTSKCEAGGDKTFCEISIRLEAREVRVPTYIFFIYTFYFIFVFK